MDNFSSIANHDQNAITALAQSSLVSMILLDDQGLIRFLNEPAKFALPHLKYGFPLASFVHEAHQGRLETCLQLTNDFSPKLVQLRFKKLNVALVWEVFRSNKTGEFVLLTQETGFAHAHREQLIRQQEEIFQVLEDGYFEMDISGAITSINHTLKNWLADHLTESPKLEEWFEYQEDNFNFYQKLKNLKHQYISEEGVCYFTPTKRWCRFELVSRAGLIIVRLTDISNEIVSDEALKQAQSRMVAILESTGDANLLIENSGKLLSFNKKASEVVLNWLGFLPEEGIDFRSRLALQRAINFDELFEKANSGEFVSFEIKVNNLPGKEYWFNVRIFPAKNGNGEVFGVSLNLSDITKHKEVEQILVDTERKLLALFSATNEAMVVFDTNRIVKFFNQRFLQLPHFIKNTLNVVKGCTISELGLIIPQIDLEYILTQTLEGKSQQQIVEINNNQFGSSWWSLATYPTLTAQGGFLGAVLILEEVTDEYLNKQEIVNRHNQLRELAQIHSHEVRKPLANVLGLLEMISTSIDEDFVHQEQLKSYLSSQIAELDIIIQQLNKRNEA